MCHAYKGKSITAMSGSMRGVDSQLPVAEEVPIEEYKVVPPCAEQNTRKQQKKYSLLDFVG